jgi:hypothetical protein
MYVEAQVKLAPAIDVRQLSTRSDRDRTQEPSYYGKRRCFSLMLSA